MKLVDIITEETACTKGIARAKTIFRLLKKGRIPITDGHFEYQLKEDSIRYSCAELGSKNFIYVHLETNVKLPFPFIVKTQDEGAEKGVLRDVIVDDFTETTKRDFFKILCRDLNDKLEKFNIRLASKMS